MSRILVGDKAHSHPLHIFRAILVSAGEKGGEWCTLRLDQRRRFHGLGWLLNVLRAGCTPI